LAWNNLEFGQFLPSLSSSYSGLFLKPPQSLVLCNWTSWLWIEVILFPKMEQKLDLSFNSTGRKKAAGLLPEPGIAEVVSLLRQSLGCWEEMLAPALGREGTMIFLPNSYWITLSKELEGSGKRVPCSMQYQTGNTGLLLIRQRS
jgi:hypothetical protein